MTSRELSGPRPPCDCEINIYVLSKAQRRKIPISRKIIMISLNWWRVIARRQPREWDKIRTIRIAFARVSHRTIEPRNGISPSELLNTRYGREFEALPIIDDKSTTRMADEEQKRNRVMKINNQMIQYLCGRFWISTEKVKKRSVCVRREDARIATCYCFQVVWKPINSHILPSERITISMFGSTVPIRQLTANATRKNSNKLMFISAERRRRGRRRRRRRRFPASQT